MGHEGQEREKVRAAWAFASASATVLPRFIFLSPIFLSPSNLARRRRRRAGARRRTRPGQQGRGQQAKSPCRGKAADGGDLGFHYTPELIELMREAFKLRDRGVIKF